MTPTHSRTLRTRARLLVALSLALSLVSCGGSEDEPAASSKPTTTTYYEGSYTPMAAEAVLGNNTFTQPEDADRTDADSTAEVTALMLHSWDTTQDTTQTAAAIRAKPLMSEEWAKQQIEPERNAAQGAWLNPGQHQAYSSPSLIAATTDVTRDVADDKAIRVYDMRWRWISREGTDLPDTGRQLVTIYLEKHNDQWDVVGHQFQDMGS